MKSYIYASDAQNLLNGQYKVTLPWSQESSNEAYLKLEDCNFIGKFKNVMMDETIQIQSYMGTDTIYYSKIGLGSPQDFIYSLNERIIFRKFSFEIGSDGTNAKIVFEAGHPITVRLSQGLASVLGLRPVLSADAEGYLDLSKAYSRLLVLCPQVQGNTFVNGNQLFVLGILKPQKVSNGLVKCSLTRHFDAVQIVPKSINYITLQLVPAVSPKMPLPYTASGEILLQYSTKSL